MCENHESKLDGNRASAPFRRPSVHCSLQAVGDLSTEALLPVKPAPAPAGSLKHLVIHPQNHTLV